jgi:hypothetical protein
MVKMNFQCGLQWQPVESSGANYRIDRNELSAGNKSGVYIAVLQGIEKLFGSKPIDVDRLLVSPGAIILMERAKA